jgi:class 3 adenylate cyclase/tetratricopeptide (TPR) repeat protein
MSNQSPLELRQLTVMFCDIVDSTSLSQELDAETWRTFLENYQQICTQIFSKYGGHVYEYRGDGPLVYFGYPIAFEDSAYRAVAAGLEIKQYFIQLSNSHSGPLSVFDINAPKVRISVHTGPVITGEMRGRLTATGTMIALAERLQREAPANNLIISRDTLNLVKTKFLVTKLGKRSLKGFEQACECFLVENQANLTTEPTPFMGREAELETLSRAWNELTPGKPICHLIKGEAGVGKSRLVSEFKTRLGFHESQVITLQCSPFYQNSSFYPIIQAIKDVTPTHTSVNATGVPKFDDYLVKNIPIDKHAKIRAVFGELLSTPPNSTTGLKVKTDPEEKRNTALNTLVDWFSLKSKHSPLLVLIEDIHWVDPSTLDLLKRIIENDDCGPLLLIMTYRENGFEKWSCPFPSKVLTLGSISNITTNEIIKYLAGDFELPENIVKKIIHRADGVPLFIEELTRMTVGKLGDSKADGLDNADDLNIPGSIKDLLTVRLNDLGNAIGIAQIASVIGREFSPDLIQKIAEESFDEITAYLQSMEIAGLIKKKSDSNQSQYQFKHSLISDAAYASIIASRKTVIHEKLARCLEADYLNGVDPEMNQLPARSSGQVALEPEIIAHHFTRANLTAKAIQYWLKAGQRSKRQSAQAEAISHYRQVIGLLLNPVEDAELDIPYTKMTTLLSLAACCDAVFGYSSEKAYKAYHEAEQIAIELGDQNALLMAKFGLQGYFMMRGDFNRAYRLGETCCEMAEKEYLPNKNNIKKNFSHPMAKAQAALSLGCVLFHRAEFDDAMIHLERCLALCGDTSAMQRRLRHDPVVMCLVYKAWYTWETGYPDKALALAQSAVTTARDSGLAFGTGVALAFLACIHMFRREYELTIQIATESISISEDPGYKTWLAWAKVLRGRAISEFHEQEQAGIDEVIRGLTLWDESGAIVTRPFALALLAECYQLNGQHEKALEQILIAQEMVERYGERYYLAEINIIYGNLLLADPVADNYSRAETAYRSAISFAKARKMQASVLNASICLSRLLTKQNRLRQAVDILRGELLQHQASTSDSTKYAEEINTETIKEARKELSHLEMILATEQAPQEEHVDRNSRIED